MIRISLDQSQTLNELSSDDEVFSNSPEQSPRGDQPVSLLDVPFDEVMDLPRRTGTQTLKIQVQFVANTIESGCETKEFSKEYIKELVSKQKKRYCLDGFNLDLSYITPNLIAMGFPAEKFEAIYRNSMSEVQRFLNTKHKDRYMVINLCSEKRYKHDNFYNVMEFPFDDHNAPPFRMIYDFCLAVEDWLAGDLSRITVVHCKAGKGRTGLMVCCYLLFSKHFHTAKDSLKYYGLSRTEDSKGVTIPSQIRYVEYFNHALHSNYNFSSEYRSLELNGVMLTGLPNFGIFGGCKPSIRIQNNQQELISKDHDIIGDQCLFSFTELILQGDVLIQFFHQSIVTRVEDVSNLVQYQFHCD